MKINEIRLENFGKYKNPEASIEFKKGINVVYGQNEAGKSTLFNGLLTLLYGFKPANREAHPYLGWGENKIELSGIFEDAHGTFTVERKLQSSPSGHLIRNDNESKINNNALEQVQDISKQTFESIYALTLHDVVKMQDTAWSEIEDRLILNYGIDAIKSPRDVLVEIEEEMKVLFNPRGQAKNTKVKRLENEIKILKIERKKILESQESVVEKEALLKQLEIRLELALKEEAVLEKKLQWWEKHQNIIDLLMQLEGVRQQSTQLSKQIGDIPEGVRTYKDQITKDTEIKKTHMTLKEIVRGIENKLEKLTVNEQICVDKHSHLQGLLKAYQEYEKDLALHLQGKEFVNEKKYQLNLILSDILEEVTSQQVFSLASLNMMTIESKIERIATLTKDTESLQREIYAASQKPVDKNNLLAIGLIGAGVGLYALGLYLNQATINYGAVLFLSFGAFKLFNSKNKSNEEDVKLFDDKIKFNNKKIEEETMMVHQSLAFLNLSKEDIVENGQRLLMVLKSSKELARAFQEKEEEYRKESTTLKNKALYLKEELRKLEFDRDDITLELLQNLLQEALKKHEHNERINIDYRNKQHQLRELNSNLDDITRRLSHYHSYLTSIGEGDTEHGLMTLMRFEKLKEKINFLEEQLLAKDPGGVMQREIKQIDQNALNEQNAGEDQIRLREVRESVEAIKLEKRSLATDLKHLLKGVDLFDTESQLLALEDEMEEVKEAYDHLLLLKSIVSSYDQEYREFHQPDIHRRTGAYFSQITKGKYPRIYSDENIDKRTLVFRQDGEDKSVDGNLSQGARDQLYLALRLALADELDKEKTVLPIFLDEIFVNWDMERLEEGIELLETLSGERQIILLTCHEWMVEKLKELANPHIIMLET